MGVYATCGRCGGYGACNGMAWCEPAGGWRPVCLRCEARIGLGCMLVKLLLAGLLLAGAIAWWTLAQIERAPNRNAPEAPRSARTRSADPDVGEATSERLAYLRELEEAYARERAGWREDG